MKKTQEIIGLPVFSVVDGKKIGQVKDLVVNPEEGKVDFLMVSDDSWYAGARVLPYKAIMGIGEHAVTTESQNQLITITENTMANNLLVRRIDIKGTRVLTNNGNLIGVISEYMVDPYTGKITRLQYKSSQDEAKFEMIDSEQILTYGSEVIIVKEQGLKRSEQESIEMLSTKPEVASVMPMAEYSGNFATDGAVLFKQRQREFLLNKKVIQDIANDQGEIIIPAGTVVTEGIILVAENSNRFMELTQCAK